MSYSAARTDMANAELFPDRNDDRNRIWGNNEAIGSVLLVICFIVSISDLCSTNVGWLPLDIFDKEHIHQSELDKYYSEVIDLCDTSVISSKDSPALCQLLRCS
ncbi:hypothetical protein L218DRAFT_1010554 [Marasmius fiardii PR-910]|nr:hypothetical protein L218DRAFT_1010554 [Marasmius fiardii PR-910]